MPRPQKCRRVSFIPEVTYFKPAGVPMRFISEVCLSLEEVEAIRLRDADGLEQEAAAEKMNVSRPTFQRVLLSARKKVADALLNGKALRIEGGNFEMAPLTLSCQRGHDWMIQFDDARLNATHLCSVCGEPGRPFTPEPRIFPGGHGCGRHGRGWQQR